MAAPAGISMGELLLAEYQSLKDEQRARIGFRDNLLYVTLTAVAAVVIASAQSGAAVILLALPPACLILGWTYLVNDEKISAIGHYVRTDLEPRLAALVEADGEPGQVFRWEGVHRADARRASRKAVQCGVDIAAFCVVPLAALIAYWASGPLPAPLLVVSAAEVVALAGLAQQIVLYARAHAA